MSPGGVPGRSGRDEDAGADRAVLIIGAGSHGRVLLACLQAMGRPVDGFVDAGTPAHALIDGCPVLGDDSILERYRPDAIVLVNGLGRLPERQRLCERLTAAGFEFCVAIHPSVVISGPVDIGPACQLMAGVVLQPGVRLGANVLVNTGAVIDHECELGAHAVVAPGAVLCGNVRIGDGATVGPGATITRGCRVGARSIVAAGAVVVADVADGATVVGVPARPRDGDL